MTQTGKSRPRPYRMTRQCEDCPFHGTGKGYRLRRSLRPGRWIEILAALRRDGHFMCHKTTMETGNGTNLLCQGAIEWQRVRGLGSQYLRICERLRGGQA